MQNENTFNKFDINDFIRPNTIIIPLVLSISTIIRSAICINDESTSIFFLGYAFSQIPVSYLYNNYENKNLITFICLILMFSTCCISKFITNDYLSKIIIFLIGSLTSCGFIAPISYHSEDKNKNNYLVPLCIGLMISTTMLYMLSYANIVFSATNNYLCLSILIVSIYFLFLSITSNQNANIKQQKKEKTSGTLKNIISIQFILMMITCGCMSFIGITYIPTYLAPYISKYKNIEIAYSFINMGLLLSFLSQYIISTLFSIKISFYINTIINAIGFIIALIGLKIYNMEYLLTSCLLLSFASNNTSLCIFSNAKEIYQKNSTIMISTLNLALIIPIYIYPNIVKASFITRQFMINNLVYSAIISIIGSLYYALYILDIKKHKLSD